jgi:hypothetical protein
MKRESESDLVFEQNTCRNSESIAESISPQPVSVNLPERKSFQEYGLKILAGSDDEIRRS